jgi:hypothetical protein
VKYSGLRNQLAALRAQLPQAGLKIVITGGLPSNASAAVLAQPEPQQLDLPLPSPSPPKARGRVFAKPGPDPPAETPPRAPLADSAPTQPPGWEAAWWRDQRRRRP